MALTTAQRLTQLETENKQLKDSMLYLLSKLNDIEMRLQKALTS